MTSIDLLWFYGKSTNPHNTVGWNGFMEMYYKSDEFSKSRVIPLPFVNAPPSDYDTIFTVLIEAAEKCKFYKQKTCFVTFDQPLYYKSREILASVNVDNDPYNLSSVIVRLGGFHTLMSFLGSIGYIMDGSGLREAFYCIYAQASVEKVLTGHAFSRAVRGHILIQAILADTIISSLKLNETEVELLNDVLSKINEENFLNEVEKDSIKNIKDKFLVHFEKLKENGLTTQLWLQYFEMVAIVKKFIEAERTGNWKLHLICVQKMIPYFYASGHHLYAKSSQLYLQDMLELNETDRMDLFEYNKFCTSGNFTIRRTDKYWSGIWTDMTIEQVLMRSMKSSGGSTHGRGITDSVTAKWILSSIVLTDVCNVMEEFCNVSYATSEQHVDTRISRISRDEADLEKIRSFFKNYNPFPITDHIMSIFSGVIGDSKINCYKALEVGTILQNNAVGKDFASAKFQRKNKVLPLRSINSSIKVNEETITIDPLLLFQRISLNVEQKSHMKEYLQYELAPFPLSIFDEGGMRKCQKNSLFDHFKCLKEVPSLQNSIFVIDGNFLLQKVQWHQNDDVRTILSQYVNFVKTNFQATTYVVFDGIANEGTSFFNKSNTKLCKKNKNLGREIIFDIHTKITFSQANFLSNVKNKKKLIELLCVELENANIQTKISTENLERLIVKTAMEVVSESVMIKIYSQNVDVLVILTQLAPFEKNILFVKCNTGRTPTETFNMFSFKHEVLKPIIAFLHIFSGCDTTSSFYRQNKNKLIKILIANKDLVTVAKKFYEKDAKHKEIEKCGKAIIAKMYAGKKEAGNLHELRFLHFQKSTLKSNFRLESLPPTDGTATQHSFRTFLQLQEWLGNKKIATDWGWKASTNGLKPIYTVDKLIPDDLIKKITCKCETGCRTLTCGCRKHGLRCTELCQSCNGENCTNIDEEIITDLVDNIDEENFDDELIDCNQDCMESCENNIDENDNSDVNDDDEDNEENNSLNERISKRRRIE